MMSHLFQHRVRGKKKKNYIREACQEGISCTQKIKGRIDESPTKPGFKAPTLFQENGVGINDLSGSHGAHTCLTRKTHYSILLHANNLYSRLTEVSLSYIYIYLKKRSKTPGEK